MYILYVASKTFPSYWFKLLGSKFKPTGLLHPKRILLLPNRWALLQITIVFDCDEADIAAQLNTTANPLVKKDNLQNDTEIWKGIFGSDVSTWWVNGLLELARSVFQIERQFLCIVGSKQNCPALSFHIIVGITDIQNLPQNTKKWLPTSCYKWFKRRCVLCLLCSWMLPFDDAQFPSLAIRSDLVNRWWNCDPWKEG